MIFECVINVSEGRRNEVLTAIAQAGGDAVVDIHRDGDHNRSVFTIASKSLNDVYESAQKLTAVALDLISFESHTGVHPRLGVVDVVPFISYDGNDVSISDDTLSAAHLFAAWAHETFLLPIFFYDHADKTGRTLPSIRKHAFGEESPSLGTDAHYQHGSMCVGVREPLIAINVNLVSNNRETANLIAKNIRKSSGGIPGVRALGMELQHHNSVQVSMNIVDCINVNVGEVCLLVRELAAENFIDSHVELVGLMPEFAYRKLTPEFLGWSGLSTRVVIENNVGEN